MRYLTPLSSCLLLLSVVFFASCSKDQPDHSGPVNLSDLKVGQVSYFHNFSSTCEGVNEDFAFQDRVIKLEVTQEDGLLMFRETAEEGFFGAGNYELATYAVYPHENYLLMPEHNQSMLFFFYSNDTIYLKPNPDVTLEQDGCVLMDPNGQFIGNDIGNLPSYEVGLVKTYNKTAVSCVPGWMNIDAYLIYDANALHVSHVVNSGFGGGITIDSWVLVD